MNEILINLLTLPTKHQIPSLWKEKSYKNLNIF